MRKLVTMLATFVTCLVCGKEFRSEDGRRSLCGDECRKLRARAQTAKYRVPIPRKWVSCPECQCEFDAGPTDFYCSSECQLEYARRKKRGGRPARRRVRTTESVAVPASLPVRW